LVAENCSVTSCEIGSTVDDPEMLIDPVRSATEPALLVLLSLLQAAATSASAATPLMMPKRTWIRIRPPLIEPSIRPDRSHAGWLDGGRQVNDG
jgi:hypothetical protein